MTDCAGRGLGALILAVTLIFSLTCVVLALLRLERESNPPPTPRPRVVEPRTGDGPPPEAAIPPKPAHPEPVPQPTSEPTEVHETPPGIGTVHLPPKPVPSSIIWASRDVDMSRPGPEVDRVVGLLRDAVYRLRQTSDDMGDAMANSWSKEECRSGLADLSRHEEGLRELLRSALDETDMDVAEIIGEALVDVGSSVTVKDALQSDLRSENRVRRRIALLALGRTEDPVILDRYREIAADIMGTPVERTPAIKALGHSLTTADPERRGPETIDILRRLAVGDASPEVRTAALRSLSQAKDTSSEVKEFIRERAQSDPESSVRDEATRIAENQSVTPRR